jgi:SAM-dependent methyltransferase
MKLLLLVLFLTEVAAWSKMVQQPSTRMNSQHQCRSIVTSRMMLATNDDGEAISTFGTKEYWDEVYQGFGDFPADEYSWYFGFGGYGKFVKENFPNKESSDLLLPGIGNDPAVLDLLEAGYQKITATDYSEHAIERQEELLSYQRIPEGVSVDLFTMDARDMRSEWSGRFDGIIEKGALDAIYLSGGDNLRLVAKEFQRVLKPDGLLISVSGVVPEELRREVFAEWTWLRDGSEELKAGCFVLRRPQTT